MTDKKDCLRELERKLQNAEYRLSVLEEEMEHEIKKVFDANYGNANAYHIDVWRYEYPELRYGA